VTLGNRVPVPAPGLPPGRRLDRLIAAHCAIAAVPPTGDEVAFIYSGFVRFTLPHREIAGHAFQRRDGDLQVTFMSPPHIGLPFGKVPRLLLVHLTTQAVRTRKREIELGSSLSKFMRSLFMAPTGGPHGSIRPFKSQLLRILSLTTTVSLLDTVQARLANAPLADTFEIHWAALESDGRGGAPARLRLGERMFEEMLASAVPVDLRAVRALQQSTLALDLYFWTTYRSPRVARTHPACIAWSDLMAQFGASYARESDFRIAFRHALEQVRAVYPALNCSITETQFELNRSRPSVPPRVR